MSVPVKSRLCAKAPLLGTGSELAVSSAKGFDGELEFLEGRWLSIHVRTT